jgi:hypothetical protein
MSLKSHSIATCFGLTRPSSGNCFTNWNCRTAPVRMSMHPMLLHIAVRTKMCFVSEWISEKLRFTTGWKTFRWWRGCWNGGAETIVKRLLCCAFRRAGKAMEQLYQFWWRICREINVFSMFEYQMFYILYPIVTYLLTIPYITLS